jgi:hypothetical protein
VLKLRSTKGNRRHVGWGCKEGSTCPCLKRGYVRVLTEATQRAENALKGKTSAKQRFLPLPVGDSRQDNHPVIIRDNQGLNFYYQGQVDNCVMGGLANAVFWMFGPEASEALLKNFSPAVDEFWFRFVKHFNHSMMPFSMLLKKVKHPHVLKMEDSFPVVVQLRSGDKSETHAICISVRASPTTPSSLMLMRSSTCAGISWLPRTRA